MDVGGWGIYSRRTGVATAIDKLVEPVGKGFRCRRSGSNGCLRRIGKYGDSVIVDPRCSGTLTVAIFAFDKDGLGAEWLFFSWVSEMGSDEEGGRANLDGVPFVAALG